MMSCNLVRLYFCIGFFLAGPFWTRTQAFVAQPKAVAAKQQISTTMNKHLVLPQAAAETMDSLLTSVTSAAPWDLPWTWPWLFFGWPMDTALTTAGWTTCAATAMTIYALAHPPVDYRRDHHPYPRGHYDPLAARDYYTRHPLLVARRTAELLRLSGAFWLRLALDVYVTKQEVVNRKQHASDLLELITKMGPTAIKIGQALSVRTDILPEEYAVALRELQDKVPPFDHARAQSILRQELGLERLGLLEEMSAQPLASASIGQVYKARVDDTDVAVKIQRPNVLAEIALDLYLARELAPLYQRLAKSPTDFQVLANEWGRGFIAELDYRQEALHTQRFNDEMAARKMDAVVCAPQVLKQLSTEKVLVTEWVEGTRIDQSPNVEDIPRLCSVALNAYLVMLLEMRSLHCDPHPGNLLVTSDGQLVILDFGMVLEIDPALQWSLLEYVAHLTSGDYDELAEDMAKLGFLRADKVDFVRRSGVLEPLKYFLQQAGKGGGAKVKDRIFDDLRVKHPGKTDGELRTIIRKEMEQQIQEIVERESLATGLTVELEELERQNKDAFKIPEWFVYTSRAFLTLEGVSLAADEDYSLIKSCFPYIAKRLMADDDPRARKALKAILYGAGGSSIDMERLADLADGFSSYTTTTKTVTAKDRDGNPLIPATGGTERLSDHQKRLRKAEVEAVVALAKDSADILLNPKGSMVQRLLLEESAKAASARVKDTLRHAVTGPEKFRESLPLGLGGFLPTLPFEHHVRSQVAPFIEKTNEEIKALELTEKLSQSLTSKAPNNGRDAQLAASKFVKKLRELDPEHAAMVVRELQENLPRYGPLVSSLGNKFVTTLLNTASHNIESTLDKFESSGMIGATAKGLSNVAQQGAKALSWDKDNNNVIQAVPIQLSGNSTMV